MPAAKCFKDLPGRGEWFFSSRFGQRSHYMRFNPPVRLPTGEPANAVEMDTAVLRFFPGSTTVLQITGSCPSPSD